MTPYKMNTDGSILINFEDELEQIASMGDQSHDLLNWITGSNTDVWMRAAGLSSFPLEGFTNDQEIS